MIGSDRLPAFSLPSSDSIRRWELDCIKSVDFMLTNEEERGNGREKVLECIYVDCVSMFVYSG